MNYQLLIILVSTILLIALSWRSLRWPHYHGFYRFFAWELIVIQIAVNLPVWFKTPFRWYQLISWFLLCMSIYVGYQGISLLNRLGGKRIKNNNNPNYPFENTSNLVTEGIYAYIRHPMYCSLLLLSWGVFFKLPSVWGILLVFSASICLYLTVRMEEKENIQRFGDRYLEYMTHSNMFIPHIL